MTIAITTVLPVPVAILAHIRLNSPPSPGMSIPTFSLVGSLGEPDQRLYGLKLAEEEATVLERPLGRSNAPRGVW